MRYDQVQETIDHSSGETLTTTRSFTKRGRQEPFAMLPLPLHKTLSLLRGKDMQVFLTLVEASVFNKNVAVITGESRLDLLAQAECTSSQLSTVLQRLQQLGAVRKQRGQVLINPNIVWKGMSQQREDAVVKWGELLGNQNAQ